MERYNNGVCEFGKAMSSQNDDRQELKGPHKVKCARCFFKTKADDLSIEIYEWPLSPNLPVAKATVFELKVPQAYSDWRDASIHLITDVLRFRDEKAGRPIRH
jgi:hypothetical protein